MSLNHFSTNLQETPCWPHQQQQMEETNNNSPTSKHHPQRFSSWPSNHHHLYHHQQHQQIPSMFSPHNHPAFSFNLNQDDNNNDDQESVVDDRAASTIMNLSQEQQEVDREPMFEKPLTPSDVGKLNRLVIPKQHAEKYFPLGGGGDSGDKGLLLSFEDESGKCWRFRYSYWNSSQSYVLTKGWSRYVKEKRLDAGDVILFERHRTDTERLFIGWRRRGAATVVQDGHGGGGGGWSRGLYSGPGQPYPAMDAHGVTVSHQPDCLHAGSLAQNQAAPVGNLRTLRLFGVNMECQLDESEPSTPDGSSLSSQQGQTHAHHLQQFNYSEAYSSNRHNHMDISFAHDVNQMMRNRQG